MVWNTHVVYVVFLFPADFVSVQHDVSAACHGSGMTERPSFRLELFSRGGHPQSPVLRVFEFPCPGLPAEARIFGIIKCTSGETTITVISLIRNALRSAEILHARTLNSGLEGKFEAILLAVNRGYAELAANHTVPESPLPHALLGLIVYNELFLSSTGDVEAYLFHTTKNETPTHLLTDEETGREQRVLFQTILSGTLKEKDTLFVTTSELFDYLTLLHLDRVVSKLEPREIRIRLLELLGDVQSTVSLSGVIVNMAPVQVAPVKREIPFLHKLKPSTEASESKTVSIPETSDEIASVQTKTKFAVPVSPPKEPRPPSKALLLGRAILNKQNRKEVMTRLFRGPERMSQRWNALSDRNQILLIVCIVCTLLFGEGIRFLVHQKQDDAVTQKYNQQVANIQSLRDAIEASLIYKDESKALTEYNDALAAIRTLPTKTETQKKTAQDLTTQIQAEGEKLQHIVRLDTQVSLATLPQNAGTGTTILAGTKIVSLVTDTGGVWNWQIDKKTLAPAITPFLPAGSVLQAFVGKKSPLYFANGSILERSASSTTTTTIALSQGIQPDRVTYWNNKLYALGHSSQVYKGTLAKNTWNLTTAALKNPPTSQIADIQIDSAIWLLGQTEVQKYLSGEKQQFTLALTNPLPVHFSRLWTTETSPNLFILDDSTHHLFVFGKDGTFKTQFVGGPINDLKDLAFNAKTNTVWLLTTTNLFAVQMP